MSFLSYLPSERGRLRRTATLLSPAMSSNIHSVHRDDAEFGRQVFSGKKSLGVPSASARITGSLQDLSKLSDSSASVRRKGSFVGGDSSPRALRSSKLLSGSLNPVLNYLDYDAEAQATKNMNVQLLLHQRENEYVSKASFSVLCGTYNVNSQSPGDADLKPWLSGHSTVTVPDIIAVAFQELDNSSQAYLFTESPKEPEWNSALAKAIHDLYVNDAFVKFRFVRLVGIMLVIFVRDRHVGAIDNVDTASVGCGLLGRVGNKGGVSIRFNLHDTSVCFVSSHLSAHLEESDRRNQDFREINTRMIFTKTTRNGEALRIDQHDLVFWMGDLNYRIVGLNNEKCKAAIDTERFDVLFLNHDQLHKEMEYKRVFNGYNEGEIKFRPTYKYDTGSDRWDSSEKARIPAWCDRVLWKVNTDDLMDGDPVRQVVYRSHIDIRISDHRPVSSIFNITVRIVDAEKYETVYKQILRDFDKNENQQRPQAEPDQREIDFGEIKFLESFSMNICIKNTGTVPLQFAFKPTPNHPHNPAPRWLTVMPTSGHISEGHSANVQLTARIDPDLVNEIALTQGRKFSDVLVLHLVCGGDTFIPVHGCLAQTCFGLPLSVLNSVSSPIGLLDPSELASIMGTPPEKLQKSFPLPKEVFRLVDRLSSPDALKHKELFRVQGTLHDKIRIRDALDLTFPGEPLPGSISSAGEVLLDFLQSLPTPLVPVALQPACKAASNSTELSVALLDNSFQKNSPKHHALFLYLIKFLGEFIRHRRENNIDIPFLAGLFAEVAFRHSPSARTEEDRSSRESHLLQAAVNFILRLLAKEAGLTWDEVNMMQIFMGESEA